MKECDMNRSVTPEPRGLLKGAFRRTEDDPRDSHWCEACREPLLENALFTAHWGKPGRRASFCRECLGEIFFDVLPVVTGPTPDTPAGRGSPLGEPDPWMENAVRVIEG
jgi:hypothetical protein